MIYIWVCFRIPNEITSYLQKATNYLSHNSTVKLGLSMFTLIPDEVNNADMASCVRSELLDILLQYCPTLLTTLECLCTGSLNNELFSKLICAVRSWLSSGISLSSLYCEHQCLFASIVSGVNSADCTLVIESLRLIHDVINLVEYPMSAHSKCAVLEFAQNITAGLERNAADANVLSQCSHTMTAMASKHTKLLLDESQTFFQGYLFCLSRHPRSLLENSFDFWLEVHDEARDTRHPAIDQHLMPALLSIVISHCKYSTGRQDDDEFEDFSTFRDVRLGLPDLVSACLAANAGKFFEALQQQLAGAAGAGSTSDWRDLEVVLFLLSVTAEDVKTILDGKQPETSMKVEVLLWMHHVTGFAVSHCASELSNEKLMKTICSYLGSVTHLLTRSAIHIAGGTVHCSDQNGFFLEFKPVFFQALTGLFRIAMSAPCGDGEPANLSAAKSFQKLCVHGSKWLTVAEHGSVVAPLSEVVRSFASCVGECVAAESQAAVALVIESLVRSILAVPTTHAAHRNDLLNSLSDPVLTLFETAAAVNAPLPTVPAGQRVQILLGLVSQIVRFCDATSVDGQSDTDLFLQYVVGRMWPVVQWLLKCELSEKRGDPGILIGIFLLFERLFGSLGAHAVGIVEDVSGAVLLALSAQSPCCSDAIHCAAVMCEFLAHQGGHDATQFLSGFLTRIISALSPGQPMVWPALFDHDSECVTEFFGMAYHYAVFRPSVLVEVQQNLEDIVQLAHCSLVQCSERGALRATLQYLQCAFCPPLNICPPEVRGAMVHRHLMWGERFVQLILLGITNQHFMSSLAPNISDVLLSILASGLSECRENCFGWFRTAVGDAACLHQLDSFKEVFLRAALELSERNSRRFKSLIQDIFRICSQELTADTLVAYTDM